MLLSTVGAWAQTEVILVSESVESPEHVYYIMCNNSYNGNQYYMNMHSGPASSKEKAHKFAFFAGTKEGDYKIYSVDLQKWLSYTPSAKDNTPAFAVLIDNQTDAQVWHASLAKSSTVYQFQPYNTQGSTYASYMNWNGGVEPVANTHYKLDKKETVGVWRQSADNDGGSAWVITEALQEVTFTYNYTYKGTSKLTESVTARIGRAFPAPTTLPAYVTYTLPEDNVAEEDGGTTIDVECNYNLPFEVSEDYATAKWYNMTIRSNGEKGVAKSATTPYPNGIVDIFSDDAKWAFMGNPFDGIKVLNKTAGDGYTLGVDGSSNVIMTEGANAWVIEEGVGGFLLLQEKGTNKYVHDFESSLKIWNNSGAKTDAGSAFKVYDVEAYSEFGTPLYSSSEMEEGKYYRIQSTARRTFTGIDGYTCNMKNQEGDANNPGQLWKYVKDGEKAYLQNVYAGLYPQYVNGGTNQTTAIGTSKDYAFTYSINNANVGCVWNIFFGGRQVNIESNGNVNWWTGENAHHYIYEEEVTDDELATMCMNWYNANKYVAPAATASSYQKIAIDENATEIISPSEFAAPSVINEAIDNLAAIEGTLGMEITSAGDIHSLFGALSVYASAVNALAKYKNAVTAHGELLSIAYTPKAEWGTIILPINWANPEGWTRYSCASTEGNVLALTEYAGGASKNTPLIVSVPEGKIGTTYQLIGYSNGAGTENVTTGLLTGVLEENTMVPAGSYVLARQKSTGKIGFFPVAENADYGLEKYKCYLTLPASESRYNALFFEGGETAIENVESAENAAKPVVYDLAGRRVQNAQKGVFIVNGKVVIK